MLKKAGKKIFAAILIMAMICGIFPNLGDSQEQVKASSIPKYVVVVMDTERKSLHIRLPPIASRN